MDFEARASKGLESGRGAEADRRGPEGRMRARTTAMSTERGGPPTRNTAPRCSPQTPRRCFRRRALSGFPTSPFPTSLSNSPILQTGRRRVGGWGGGDISKSPSSQPCPAERPPSRPTGFPTMHGCFAPQQKGWLSAGRCRGGSGPGASPKGRGLHAPLGMAPGRPQRRLPDVDAKTQGDPPCCLLGLRTNLPALGGAWRTGHFSRLGRWPQCPGYKLRLGIQRDRGFHPSPTTSWLCNAG